MTQSFVVDSSVVIKWVKTNNEEDVSQARNYYQKFKQKEIKIIIPDLVFYELANFISRDNLENRPLWDELIEALHLPPVEIIPPDKKFITDTISLSHNLKISAYDASYLAAAEKFNTKLITADKKLQSVAPDLTTPL